MKKLKYLLLVIPVFFVFTFKVSAAEKTGYSSSLTLPNNSNYYNEEIIYNIFNDMVSYHNLDLDFSDYPHVVVNRQPSGSSSYFRFWLSNEPIYVSNKQLKPTAGSNYIEIVIFGNGTTFNNSLTRISYDNVATSSSFFHQWSSGGSGVEHQYYSTDSFTSNSYFIFSGLLDFSSFLTVNLEYDEDLFANNPDFKEVCVYNYDTFSITSNNYNVYGDNDEYKSYANRDAIWFKNNIFGLNSTIYKKPSDYYIPSYYDSTYYFDSKENIDDIYSNNPIFNSEGYTDKYSYYGYSSHLFVVAFDNNENDYINVFNVFSFNNAYIDESISGGGAGTGFGSDNAGLDVNSYVYPEQFCFYIKNEYDVNILKGKTPTSIGGNATILGGDSINFEISTLNEPISYEYNEIRAKIDTFTTRMFPTISFINLHIYNLYLSMPELVRMFVIVFFSLFIIRFIIKLVMK